MKRSLAYLLLALFTLVFVYESLEAYIKDAPTELTQEFDSQDTENKSEKSEKNEKKEKEGKEKEGQSEFEEEFLATEFALLRLFDLNSATLYQDHLRSSTNYSKTVYSPPEYNSIA